MLCKNKYVDLLLSDIYGPYLHMTKYIDFAGIFIVAVPIPRENEQFFERELKNIYSINKIVA